VQTPEEYDSWLTENKIAQKQELNQAVAVKPAELSTSEFLAPYTNDMGISSGTLESMSH
jgi:cytochrome c oxidase subunit II